MRGVFERGTVRLAGAAVFGALAMLGTILIPARIQPIFPLMPVLRFDPIEIIVVTGFLIFGPLSGILASFVHVVLMLMTTSRGPLGPALKFAAILTTLLGLSLGGRILEKLPANRTLGVGVIIAGGLVGRTVLMTFVNFAVFTYVGPALFGIDYIGSTERVLQTALGLRFSTPAEVLAYMLALSGLFNAAHVLLSALPALIVLGPVIVKVPQIAQARPWMLRLVAQPKESRVTPLMA